MMVLMMMMWKDDANGALDPWSCLVLGPKNYFWGSYGQKRENGYNRLHHYHHHHHYRHHHQHYLLDII